MLLVVNTANVNKCKVMIKNNKSNHSCFVKCLNAYAIPMNTWRSCELEEETPFSVAADDSLRTLTLVLFEIILLISICLHLLFNRRYLPEILPIRHLKYINISSSDCPILFL